MALLTLIFLTKELVDMPTKFQHSTQRSKSHINHNNNSASTPIVHKHLKDLNRLTILKRVYYNGFINLRGGVLLGGGLI